ncbi:unnamed protein product [Arctogadus glacialis]
MTEIVKVKEETPQRDPSLCLILPGMGSRSSMSKWYGPSDGAWLVQAIAPGRGASCGGSQFGSVADEWIPEVDHTGVPTAVFVSGKDG